MRVILWVRRVWRIRWVKRALRLAGLVALAVVLVAIIVALLGPVTYLIAAHDVNALARPLRAAHLQAARETVRTQLLTLGAGVFAAGALIFTARNFTVSRRTFELAEQGQVTDRYTKAIEQLGSKNLTVRTGGIYALERVARDSARDQFTVMEVLAAFIRDHSREQPPLPESGADTAPLRATRLDLQAALTVIGRRNPQITQRIDLTGADLSDAILTGAELSRADLRSTDLSAADLTGANLTRANLAGAKLTGANLSPLIRASSDAHLDFTPAQLTRAEITSLKFWVLSVTTYHIRTDLTGADLTGAKLGGANLGGADLGGADLGGADLGGADLTGANLTRAKLELTEFEGADLTGALLSPGAAIPEGWQQFAVSGIVQRADTSSGNATN
jgi:uncharacterized protein YjbI with pentapeptide repeats